MRTFRDVSNLTSAGAGYVAYCRQIQRKSGYGTLEPHACRCDKLGQDERTAYVYFRRLRHLIARAQADVHLELTQVRTHRICQLEPHPCMISLLGGAERLHARHLQVFALFAPFHDAHLST